MLLVQYNDNWADEMDISGFKLMAKKEFDEMIDAAKQCIEHQGNYMFHVGTNEEIEYENIKNFKNAFTVTKITDDEYATIKKLFGEEHGFFPYPQDHLGDLELEEDEEEEDEEDK